MTGSLDVSRWGGVDRYVDLDGPVHYVDFGGAANGPRLVLVHGLGGSHLNWTLLAPLLAARARVVAIDLLGFGLSHPEGRPATVQANAKMLGRFVDEVLGSPAILVGNSMGALVSIMLASRRPDAVAGLVLIDPALPPTGVHGLSLPSPRPSRGLLYRCWDAGSSPEGAGSDRHGSRSSVCCGCAASTPRWYRQTWSMPRSSLSKCDPGCTGWMPRFWPRPGRCSSWAPDAGGPGP